jgi:dephospho-CoA kinase
LNRAEAEARIAAQASREERLAVADVILDNSGSTAHLRSQVDKLWSDLASVDAGR